MSQLGEVFRLDKQGLNVRRGLGVLVVMLVPLIVCHVINQEVYYLSVAFGALFVGLNDPGREYGYRLPRLALNAVAGALLTVLGFAIGDGAWGIVVLAAFVITLAAGLMVKYGLHGFTAAYLLNSWFLVAIALPPGYHLSHGHTSAWAQGLAWLIGSALTIAWTAIVWLARGRTAQAQPAADIIPGDTEPVPLTRPVILFALVRAIAVAIAVAIAFGFHLPNADWMPIACLVAMKSSLSQSTLVALQRLAGGGHRRRGGGAVPAGRGHQDRPGSGHRRPGHPGRVHPRRQLRLVLRGHGRNGAHRRGPAQPHQPRHRGTPGAVHLRRRRDRGPRHAAGRAAAAAHGQSGTGAACSPRQRSVNSLQNRWPAGRRALRHMSTK
jgi:hypothetical protein